MTVLMQILFAKIVLRKVYVSSFLFWWISSVFSSVILLWSAWFASGFVCKARFNEYISYNSDLHYGRSANVTTGDVARNLMSINYGNTIIRVTQHALSLLIEDRSSALVFTANCFRIKFRILAISILNCQILPSFIKSPILGWIMHVANYH